MKQNDPERTRDIVEGCLRGDPDLWSELVAEITPVIFGVCKSMRLTRDESVEIFGQTCYLLLTNLSRIRSPEKLYSYVARTVRREALRMIDRAKFLDDLLEREAVKLSPAEFELPDQELVRDETASLVHAALRLLPSEDAKLIRLLFLEDPRPSYEEISREMGMPISSIGPTRGRALERLLKILKRIGFEK